MIEGHTRTVLVQSQQIGPYFIWMDPILQFTYSVPNLVLPKNAERRLLNNQWNLDNVELIFVWTSPKVWQTRDFILLSLDLKHCRVPIMWKDSSSLNLLLRSQFLFEVGKQCERSIFWMFLAHLMYVLSIRTMCSV